MGLVVLDVHEAPREAHDVAVVVLAEELGKRHRGDRRGADARNLVGRERHTDARTADEHAEVCLSGGDDMRDLHRVVRVVDGVPGVRAQIDDLATELTLDIPCENAFLVESAMI